MREYVNPLRGLTLERIVQLIEQANAGLSRTSNRLKAFTYSLLSGLAEPVSAGVAYLALRVFLGGVAGIMVYISLDELLPTSRAYGKVHDSLFGPVGGMLVMAQSLLLMR